MPDIKPFCGILYNPSKVDFSNVVAPPYDVISPLQQNDLYAASPQNIVRLILGREQDRYAEAARNYLQWKNDGVLTRDTTPSFYLLAQNFSTPDGSKIERIGFIARCRLEDFSKGTVLPHEKTHSKPKEDRFQLMQAVKANFSQIFCLYNDLHNTARQSYESVRTQPPVIDVTYEGVRNRLWRMNEPENIESLTKATEGKKIFVADGHHRYETALAYRDLMMRQNPRHTGNESYNYVMMYLANIDDSGLIILPTHRVLYGMEGFNAEGFLHDLDKFFHVEKFANAQELLSNLHRHQRYAFGIVAALGPKYVLCSLRESLRIADLVEPTIPTVLHQLDVILLHNVIIEKILCISQESQLQKRNLDYVKDAEEAVSSVKSGKAQVVFLLNATPIEQVRAVAEAGQTMPQKSTYFYPKLLSGLVINSLDDEQ